MLSILVPIFNFDVTNFVSELHQQCINENIEFEIICIDDKSTLNYKKINSTLKTLPNVSYTELDVNIGRSKIRNLLAEKANFNNLLFVDCDSKISSTNYIKNYLSNIENYNVIYGGRNYLENCDNAKKLRWLYGVKRESISASIRNMNPHTSFMANNFLIKKEIYNSIKMDETITEYGHEDTLFGKELKRKNISILHIDNPLTHIGLENSSVFLDKTKNGIVNLCNLYKKGKIGNEISLISAYEKYKILIPFYLPILTLLKSFFIKNLKSDKPNLLYFDLYKLMIFNKIIKDV